MADGVPRKPREIADILGLTPGAASAAMRRMARAGVLEKLGTGQYRCVNGLRLAPDPAPAPSDHWQAQEPAPTDPPTGRLAPGGPPQSQPSPRTQQDASQRNAPFRDQVARGAFAAKLWLRDAALFRLDDYHWEKRRRRMHDRDRKTGRAPAR